MICPVIITEEENWYVATDSFTNVSSQGKSIEESITNLKEALELYYENAESEKNNTPPVVMLTTLEVSV